MQPSNPPGLDTLSLPAEFASLEKFQTFVQERMDSAGLPPPLFLKIELVLEEVLLNIFKNAYDSNQDGFVEVACGSTADDQGFVLRFTDQGRSFNPLDMPDPDVTLAMEDRKVGGLGILLIKEVSRFQEYRRQGDANVLEIVFDT